MSVIANVDTKGAEFTAKETVQVIMALDHMTQSLLARAERLAKFINDVDEQVKTGADISNNLVTTRAKAQETLAYISSILQSLDSTRKDAAALHGATTFRESVDNAKAKAAEASEKTEE